jgi:hypothetical protein
LNLAHSFADFAFPLYFAIPMHSPLSSFIVPLPVVLLGPYGGQYSQLGKAITKLSILDAHHFCLVSLSPFCPQIHWFSYGFTSPSCGLTLWCRSSWDPYWWGLALLHAHPLWA